MDSVSDICKYHLLCFVTIIEVKVNSGQKRSSKKICDLELWYMFIGQIFAKNAKNDPKTLFDASKSVKKIKLGKSWYTRNYVKNACFWHVLCHISAIFEDIDLNFCAHIHQPLFCNIWYIFSNFSFWGEKFWKEKNVQNLGKFGFFSKFW